MQDPPLVCRAWLLLRGVRGQRGVRWLALWLLEHVTLWTQSWDLSAAVQLLQDFDAHCLSTEGGSASWAGHNEGRHAALSGRHFLRALASHDGIGGLAEAVSRLSHIMRRLLSRGSAVSADIWVDVAESLQGTLLLAVAPTRRRVGRYNAMDFARGLAA